MIRMERRQHGTGMMTALKLTAAAGALALAFTGCGSDSGSQDDTQGAGQDTAHEAEPREYLPMVPGYDYENTSDDPIVAQVVSSYEAIEWYPPPLEVAEDFGTGSGPFWTYEEGPHSAQAVEGVLRLQNSDPEFSTGSYAELDQVSDAVVFSTTLSTDRPLGTYEGPSLVIERAEASGYEMAIEGSSAVLYENNGPDDWRQIDSQALPVPATGPLEMTLYASTVGEGTGVVGLINGTPVVFSDSCTGPFEAVVIHVYTEGQPLTADIDSAAVWARASGQPLPDLFAAVREHTVLQGDTAVATLAVLEPSDYLADFPLYSDPQQTPKALVDFPPEGVEVSTDTIGGAEVVTGEYKGFTFWVWSADEAWSVISAQDATAGKAFAEAYFAQEQADAGEAADEA